jgi:hypothetical protein
LEGIIMLLKLFLVFFVLLFVLKWLIELEGK